MAEHQDNRDRVKVKVIDQTRGKQANVVLPSNVAADRLTTALARQLGLPLDGAGGQDQAYYLTLEKPGGGQGQRLQGNQTLADTGITDGAVLRIFPQMTAGQ